MELTGSTEGNRDLKQQICIKIGYLPKEHLRKKKCGKLFVYHRRKR